MKNIVMSLDVPNVSDLHKEHRNILREKLYIKVLKALLWTFFGLFTIYSLWKTGFFEVAHIIKGFGKLTWLLKLLFPPTHGGFFLKFLHGILETVAMAFIGTLAASIISLPLGFLGAKNVIKNKALHIFLRRIFDFLRSIDALIWALIFINVVGLTPFAGILAIMMSDIGTLSKLYAESIENLDYKQVEGVKSSGAGFLQTLRYGIFPQVSPVMISNSLYYLESNTRSASILGIVGAGGIGVLLYDRIGQNNWDQVAFIVIMILVTVYIIDHISKTIRDKFIQPDPGVEVII